MMILESVLHSKTKCVYFSLLLVPHWEFNCAGSIVMLRGRALIISLPMERNIYICIPGALYIMTNTALFLAGDRKNLLAIVQKTQSYLSTGTGRVYYERPSTVKSLGQKKS